MRLEFTYYAAPLLIGVMLLMVIAVMGWRLRHNTPASMYLIGLCFSVSTYLFGYAFELSSTSVDAVRFWLKIQYIGVPYQVLALFMMTQAYAGRQQWLMGTRRAALFVIPTITMLLAWTNESHDLIWQNITIDRSLGFTGTQFDGGMWYWVQTSFTYALIGYTLFTLAAMFRRGGGVYRRQIVIISLGVIAPVVANVVFLTELTPANLDTTTYGFVFLVPLTAAGMFYYRLFDLAPIANEAVFASMIDPVIVLDRQKRLVNMNPAARAMFALTDHAIGATLNDTRLHTVIPLLDDGVCETELNFQTPAMRYFDMRIQHITRRGGGYVLVLRDITSRRKIEQEQRQLITELDSFTHTVAHDLKNPLTVLSGYSLMLQEEWHQLPENTVDEYLDLIVQYGYKMTSIINELLLLAGIRKMDEFPLRPLDMAHIVREAQSRLVTLIDSHQAQINCADTWPTARSHAPWIEEVWSNYISNAIKYGGTPPEIEIGADPPSDGSVRFWVRDNGPGLTPDQQAQLFTEFTRLDTLRAEGHGLGLSIVHRIVEKLGGTVGVEDAPGGGCLFYFTLPHAEP